MSQAPMIAIIDDDESVRVATESLVRSLGLGTNTFASAEEFLSSPLLADTSCLITDVQDAGHDRHGTADPIFWSTEASFR